MHFCLLDRVVDRSETGIVTVKAVSAAEEYLQDHFAGFPVLPGVFMLEAMVQAARAWLGERDGASARYVLGEVRALKYASFVRPGEVLRCDVTLFKENEASGEATFKGEATVERDTERVTCASGRFTMRGMRVE
ncbi:MAG: beta-hydroxyacyl-ACP dehydratase [Planctomycetota bacterium]